MPLEILELLAGLALLGLIVVGRKAIRLAVERTILWACHVPRREFEAWRAWRAEQDEDA